MFYSNCQPGNRVSNVFGDVENVFNHLFDNAKSSPNFQPSWDVSEGSDSFEVTLEIPGVKPEDVSIEFEDGKLTVTGEKSIDRSAEDVSFHRTERATGQFQRALEFKTPVEVDGIEASFEHGLLMVKVPKSEKAVARKIEIRSNS